MLLLMRVCAHTPVRLRSHDHGPQVSVGPIAHTVNNADPKAHNADPNANNADPKCPLSSERWPVRLKCCADLYLVGSGHPHAGCARLVRRADDHGARRALAADQLGNQLLKEAAPLGTLQ